MKPRSTRKVRGGVELSIGTSRLEAVPSSKLAEQRQHQLDKMILQVRKPIGSQSRLRGVFRVGLVVKRFGKAELLNKRPCHA